MRTQAPHSGSRATKSIGIGWKKKEFWTFCLEDNCYNIRKNLFIRYLSQKTGRDIHAKTLILASAKGHVIPFWFGCVEPRDTGDALKAIIRYFDDSFFGHLSPSFSWCVTTVKVNENAVQPFLFGRSQSCLHLLLKGGFSEAGSDFHSYLLLVNSAGGKEFSDLIVKYILFYRFVPT